MVKAGVDAELHLWDGLDHAFFYNIDLPESREACDVMSDFFRRHLRLAK
jgi:epsilon-lactone hydrolase